MVVALPCFAPGSRIRAARGEVSVESVVAGEEVFVLRDGKPVLEPVKWVGHTYVDLSSYANKEDAAPIRFRAGSISEGQPVRDLVVSPEHCFILDGLCVPAKLLVNGGSILTEPDVAPFHYYHVELERHGILIAENTPLESYLDTGNRSMFDNADVPRQLRPAFVVDEASDRWVTDACAPLARVPDDVAPIWARLAERSAQIGYPVPTGVAAQDAGVHLLVDERQIYPLSNVDGCLTFAVPADAASVHLMSKSFIPADKMVAEQRDTRRLGISVDWISIRSDDGEAVLSSDHPGLVDGWNEAERDEARAWRWTNGSAAIPWTGVTGAAIVTVRCSTVAAYPVYDRTASLAA